MAHFHRPQGTQKLSSAVVTAARGSILVGLWGFRDSPTSELIVRANSPRVTATGGSVVGNSRLWTIAGHAGADAIIEAVTAGGAVWDSFRLRFRNGLADDVIVRTVTREYAQSVGPNGLSVDAIPPAGGTPVHVISEATFRAGDHGNAPQFVPVAQRSVRTGVFSAHKGGSGRAVILAMPSSGTPSRILCGITHPFAQSAAGRDFWRQRNWGNPFSPPLIGTVFVEEVARRYAPQLFASRKSDTVLLIPVRAGDGANGGQLGPFAGDALFLRTVMDSIAILTGGAFTVGQVEFFSFSGGIHDMNAILRSAAPHMRIAAVYNIDPATGTSAAAVSGATRLQFLSGQTIHGQPPAGFEYMPLARWSNDPRHGELSSSGPFDYLHNHCLPDYCVHLGIQLS